MSNQDEKIIQDMLKVFESRGWTSMCRDPINDEIMVDFEGVKKWLEVNLRILAKQVRGETLEGIRVAIEELEDKTAPTRLPEGMLTAWNIAYNAAKEDMLKLLASKAETKSTE